MAESLHPSRRRFLELGSAALATGALAGHGQTQQEVKEGEHSSSASLPLGKENGALYDENPDSVLPPATDHGNLPTFKYPFQLAHKRIE
ncbi:MAG: cupin, partial [Acidobacteriaceae bacterium]